MMNIKKFSAALIIATMTAGVPVAMAQSMDSGAQQGYGTAQAAAPVSEADLEKFVNAEKKVNDIPRYNEIASRMQTDMELRQRAQQVN